LQFGQGTHAGFAAVALVVRQPQHAVNAVLHPCAVYSHIQLRLNWSHYFADYDRQPQAKAGAITRTPSTSGSIRQPLNAKQSRQLRGLQRTPAVSRAANDAAEGKKILARQNSDQYSRRYELTRQPGQTAIDVLVFERIFLPLKIRETPP
jgi:hypothetical protein